MDPIAANNLARLLLATLNVRDPYTIQHGYGTGRVAALIAEALEQDPEEVERIRLAGELHDIGKVSVSEELLVTSSRLSAEQFRLINQHSRVAADLLASIPELADLADIVLHHHEYWDGNGYPDGIQGEDIPLGARIICVADAFDAMTHDRPYRKHLSHEAACEEINRLSGTQFCPAVVDAFNRISSRLPTVTRAAGAAAKEVEPGDLQRLDGLRSGSVGTIRSVAGDAAFRRRLLELGVVPGTKVEVTNVAPMGDPIEVAIRRARFFLRKEEAGDVIVDVGSAEPEAMRVAPRIHHAPVSRTYHLAVAGNPNTGKTTLFNALTGATGRVGNYPGITVERLTARLRLESNLNVELADVPGTYSLAARSRDEQVAMDEILGRAGSPPPDLVVVVLNATNLERGLYLLLQVQELGFPIVAAVNMMDEAWDQRLQIDMDVLSSELDISFVGVTARNGEGVEQLRETIEATLLGEVPRQTANWRWAPSEDLTGHLDELVPVIGDLLGPDASCSRRRAFALWCLMSLSDDDDLAGVPPELREQTAKLLSAMQEEGHDLDLEVTQKRYEQIDRIVNACTSQAENGAADLSRRIDSVVTHPIYGMALFLLVMALVLGASSNGRRRESTQSKRGSGG